MPCRFKIVEHLEALRWHVYDAKYDETYLVDLEEKPHGKCACKEFRFQCEIAKNRTTCRHINFLLFELLTMKRPKPPKFKDA